MSDKRPKTGPSPAEDPDNEPEGESAEVVAYLDGELDAASAAAVAAKINRDPSVRAEAEALKRTWELLDYLPLPEPSANFTERTLTSADLDGDMEQGPRSELSSRTRTSVTAAKSAAESASATRDQGNSAPRKSAGRQIALTACWLLALAAAFAGGFLIRDRYVKQVQGEKRTQINAEKRLLNNLPRYRFIESKSNLQTLDDPELFGEEP